MRKLSKKWHVLCILMLLFVAICIPQTPVQAASYVKVKYAGVTKKYKNKKTKIYVNGKKISLSKLPIFMKNGSYMGPASKIFKSSSLNVGYKSSSDHKTLTLTYNNHVLKMKSGSKVATLDGKKTEFGTAPFYAKYSVGGYKRWIIPLKSVCTRLGITYRLGSDGVIRLTGSSSSSTEATTTEAKDATASSSNKIVVVLDAGHGGQDSGATGNGKAEKNMTLAIVRAAKTYFDKDDHFQVYYTRISDTYPSLTARCDIANKVNADIFISCHINSYISTSTGSETLYNPNRVSSTKKNGLDSLSLAKAMHSKLVATTGFPNRGLVKRTDLCVLNRTKMPACLLEFGFISNKKECVTMSTNLSRYGKGVYEGVVAYMKSKNKIK